MKLDDLIGVIHVLAGAGDFQAGAAALVDGCLAATGARHACLSVLQGQSENRSEVRVLERGFSCPSSPPETLLRLREEAYRAAGPIFRNELAEPPGCVLFAALRIGSVPLGLLALADKPGGFEDGDLRAAQAFADLAALALRDASERRALQASMAQADRLASMGMLAAGVAHEINNPLSSLLYNLQLLGEDLPAMVSTLGRCSVALESAPSLAPSEALTALGQPRLDGILARLAAIQEGARRIKGFAAALSTFSRVEQDEVGPVRLEEAIEHASAMTFHEIKYRARLVKELERTPLVRASTGKLAQVFLHLLVNAAHAIAEGDAEANEVRVRSWTEHGAALAEVSDTGSGIAPEHLPRLFEPFFTTKDVGSSGLGLAICKKIVEGYGGTIACESEVGRGTRFRIVLPAAATHEARAGRASPVGTARGRILVVDDDAGILACFERMLGDHHELVCTASGAEARALLEGGSRFDLVFCDLMMPSVSGMDLHAWLAGHDPALAVRMVFMSGGAFTPKAREFLARVPNLRLEKPLEAEVVVGVASMMVATGRAAR